MTYMRLICGFFIIVCVAFIAAPAFTQETISGAPLCKFVDRVERLKSVKLFRYSLGDIRGHASASKGNIEIIHQSKADHGYLIELDDNACWDGVYYEVVTKETLQTKYNVTTFYDEQI